MKASRQCRNCLITVHKTCEEKYNKENICTNSVDKNNSTDEIDSMSNINQTKESYVSTKSSTFSVLDSPTLRSLRAFGNRYANQLATLTESESSKTDEDNNDSPVHTEKQHISNISIQTASKLVNAAAAAYNKLLELKSKRLHHSPTPELRKIRSLSGWSTDFYI